MLDELSDVCVKHDELSMSKAEQYFRFQGRDWQDMEVESQRISCAWKEKLKAAAARLSG